MGKPYDFEFDFFSADKLVCTELVYRAYDGLIRFDLVPIMGRMTLPALEIAKKFQAERPRSDRELDFVMFLDAVPAENRARLATEDEFLARSTARAGSTSELRKARNVSIRAWALVLIGHWTGHCEL